MTDHRYDDERGEWNEREDERSGQQRYLGQSNRGREYGRREETQRWESEGGQSSQRRQGYPELGWNRGSQGDSRDDQQRYSGQRDERGQSGQSGRFGSSRFGSDRVGSERQDEQSNPYRSGQSRGGQYGSGPYRGGQYGGGGSSSYFDESYGGAGRGLWNAGGGEYGRDDQERSRFDQRRSQGGASGGQRFGQAPKGYKRSDERIREDVCDALMRRADVDASEIEVQVRDGEVTLQGSVSNRSAKFAIEHVADSVPGVKDVTNSLRIKRQESERGSSASASSSSGAGSSSGSSDESRIGGARSPNTAHSPRG